MKLPHQNSKLAEQFGTTERGIRRWRSDGCPFHKGEAAVWEWLSGRRTLPTKTSELLLAWAGRQAEQVSASPPPAETPEGDAGAVPAMARLERIELELGRLVQAALASGDVARVSVLQGLHDAALKQLRLYDQAITPGRRLGDVVLRADAEDVVGRIMLGLRWGMRESILHGAERVLPGELRVIVCRAVSDCIDGFLISLADGLDAAPGGLPDWATKAMTGALRNQFPGATIGTHADVFRATMAEYTARQAAGAALERNPPAGGDDDDGPMIPRERVEQFLLKVMVPVRNAVAAVPSELACRVNPGNPDLARAELQAWADRVATIAAKGDQ